MRLNLKTLAIIFFIWNICCLLFLSFYSKTFWYDEAYSIGLIGKSFKGIWDMTALDVHPPLYYFILKIFAFIFGYNLITYHLCSLVGVLCIYLLGFFPIKRLWDVKTTFVFTLFISLLPIIIYLGTEIRMYSWLCFFVIATAVYGYESYIRPNYISYLKFTFFAICAPYTHNYGLVSVLIIYAILFVMHIFNKKKIVPLLISALVGLAIFAFWIPSLYYQVTAVKESYWIVPLSFSELPEYISFFFNPLIISSPVLSLITNTIFIIIFATMFIYFIKVNKKNISKQNIIAILFFISIFFLVFFSTAIVSFIFKPILIKRYLVSTLGCLALAISIFIASVNNNSRIIKTFGIIIIVCLLTLYNMKVVISYLNIKVDNLQNKILVDYFDEKIQPIQEDFSVIGSGHQKFIITTLSFIKPENKYRYFFAKPDAIASASWAPYPFNIEIINSLQNEPNLIFLVKNLYDIYGVEKYRNSINNLEKDEQTFYKTIKIDTIGSVEIKTLRRKDIEVK